MRLRDAIGTVLVGAAISVVAATSSSAQEAQRVPPPTEAPSPDLPVVVPQMADQPLYAPLNWEVPNLSFPTLPEDTVVREVAEDDAQLVFLNGRELGGFRPAPEGGTVFFGSGQPLWGPASPPVLPSRILRPLGTGDAGDRFLGARPPVNPVTVIPKLDETFDQRRESFAFLGGPPPLAPQTPDTNVWPPPGSVEADDTPGVPDNIPVTPPTTTPPTSTPPVTFLPGPPATTPPVSTPRPTTPVTAPTPGTTVPPRPTTTLRPTTTTVPTTTTTRPTTTTVPTTTTTTTSTTVPTTTTTTTSPPSPPPVVTTALVLGNAREDADFCLSNATGGDDNDCDRLFDLDRMVPGQPQTVRLTLWNVDPDSDTHATALRVYSAAGCTSGIEGTTFDAGTGDLCEGLRIRVDRYSDAARTEDQTCLTGCTGQGVSLKQFATDHGSMAAGVSIDSNFRVGEKAYLVLRVVLPDTGANSQGRGNENRYQGRTAAIRLTWRMVGG